MLSQTERAKRKAQSERDKKIQQRQAQSVRDKKEYQRKAQVENHKKEQTRKAQSKRDKELHRQHEQSTRGQDQSQQLKQQNSASSILPQPKSIHQNQFGLKVLSEPDREESNVDVVAVHGIGANPDYTWTTSSVNWLQHCSMLPQALPKARIMRFGYASQWFGEETIRQSLSSIANSFLSALCEEREDCKQRPLVFIGHCFGGLVIQQALNTAKLLEHRYPEVFNSAAGVLFMGTPHRGTGPITSTGLFYTLVASHPDLQVDRTVLKTLEYGNELITKVFDEFVSICNSPAVKISLCCLFEQRLTAVGRVIGNNNLKEFVVDEISGSIDGYRRYGLPVDHFRLNKFSKPDDGNYKVVQREIKRLVSEALQ